MYFSKYIIEVNIVFNMNTKRNLLRKLAIYYSNAKKLSFVIL